MDTSQSAGVENKKNPIESMTKEELLHKYKGLLGIAKHAKKAKDELAEENQKLKEQLTNCETQREADKKSLLTMKEMLEDFTNNKLAMSTEISELRTRNKGLMDEHTNAKKDLESLSIENEALRRQLDRLTEDNESLLTDIDKMEQQLQQVNVLGIEQKKNLDLLELEVEKLKECEATNIQLEAQLQDLIQTNKSLQESCNTNQEESQKLVGKYQSLKEINAEQRAKFNNLKERFIEVHKKLKQLQECKRILVESHHEYADSVSKWQLDIMHASDQLCSHIQTLSKENTELKRDMQAANGEFAVVLPRLPVLIECCERAVREYRHQNETIEELRQENEKLKQDMASHGHDKDEVDHVNARLVEEVADVQRKAMEEASTLQSQLARLEEEKLKADKEIERLRAERTTQEQATVNASEIERLTTLNQQLTVDLEAAKSTKNVLESRLPTLIESCSKAIDEQKQQNELLQSMQEVNAAKVNEDGEALQTLKEEVAKAKQNSEVNFNEMENLRKANYNLTEEASDLAALQRENNNLKAELSRLRQSDGEAQKVLKMKNDLQATTNTCEDLQTKLEKQERENTDLLNEMRELNEALKGRGDVISRQQAKQQELMTEMKKTSATLAKIEADLSAKDVLIKEKELKINKMNEENHSALQEVNRLQTMTRENEARIKSLSEEIAAMRSQFESHETQSEALSTSTISRAEELARLREVDESFEEKYNKLRSLAVRLKKKSHEQTLTITDVEKQLADSKAKYSETIDKLTSLEEEREALQKQLKVSETHADTLKAEVDKLKASKKQSNVLTLEIEAFEKSLNETTAKLTAKTTEYDLLQETLQSRDAAIEVMKKEIQILEDSKESEKLHSMELKKQMDKLQTQLKDVIHNKQELAAKLEDTQNEKQSLQADLDEINQRLAVIAAERDAERVDLINENEHLLRTISSLEDELHVLHSRLKLSERSFLDLQKEYSSYKVKAQSVLRQNQSKESSRERELEEELTIIKGEHKDLSKRLQTFLEKFQISEKTIEELQEENRGLQNRTADLMKTIADLRQHTDTLMQENKKHLETYQETLKGHRLQIEALNECHQAQMQDIQAKYDRDMAQLHAVHKKDTEVLSQKPLERLDYILMEREDAEGSEADTSHTPKMPVAKRSSHDLVPLDELLNSPAVESTYPVTERRQSLSPSIELQETKDRLHKQESRVRHLTSLLAESEQDLARLTQLNEMLKEEVRRQERTVEREKHMHNSEYLKNVVLKFVTLNNGDERTRLVPVLNTILKLSPTETEMLQNVAKGKGADNNNRSWGSYLPHWSTS